MKFNYGKEDKAFRKEWSKLKQEYKAAGMSDESIERMYEFDREDFLRKRNLSIHEVFYRDIGDSDRYAEDLVDSLLTNSGKVAGIEDIEGQILPYFWLEEISDPTLHRRLCALKKKDLELLTLHAILGYSNTEIAKSQGLHPSVISRKIKRIKKILKK